jgi:4'-phosphopantetheinyl transferase
MSKELQDQLIVQRIGTGYPFHEGISGTPLGQESNNIHVWTVNYRDLDRDDNGLSALISPDELQRASQFKETRDVRDYILRHGYLRRVLSCYLFCDPARIPLIISDLGKPDLDIRPGFPSLSFSLSHTREMVAFAVSRYQKIGIDIVKPDAGYQFSDTADYLFTPEERAVIAGTHPDQQYQTFFRIWSLKEALLKVRGGTALMMKDTDVSAIIQSPSRDGWYPIRSQEKEQEFFIHESDIGHGHHCAIVAGMSI